MAPLPTLRINDGSGGYIVINESDFDSTVHKRYQQPISDQVPNPKTVDISGLDVEVDPQLPPDSSPDRTAELQALYESGGHRAIQVIAEPLGIEKPKTGWKAAIPLIVEKERGD